MGLNFKLDVGLYRLDQQVACQRHRQTPIIAERKNLVAEVANLFGDVKLPKANAFALAA